MLAEFTRENIGNGARLGGADPVANVYAFHNLGPGDATRFLKALRACPEQPVGRVLSNQVISGNPSLYGDGRRSVAEAYRAMGELLDAFEPYVQRAHNRGGAPHLVPAAQAEADPRAAAERTTPIASRAKAARSVSMGMRGKDVGELQEALKRLGCRDKDGHPLRVDGDFGRRTYDALRAFQHAHGLDARGVFGPKTRAALRVADAEVLTSPRNPHHRLFLDTVDKVRAAEHAHGLASGPHSERIAAALTTELVREGITHVDRVEFNRDRSLVRAVQVSPVRDELGLNRQTDAISAPQASLRSIVESSRQVREAAVNAIAQQRDPHFAQQRAQPAPMLVR
jgi:hypothetical protein